MITETDLFLMFAQETGIKLEQFSIAERLCRFKNTEYLRWVEEKLIKKLNEEKQFEKEFEEIFTKDL